MNKIELRAKLKGIICATVTPFDDDFELNLGQMYDDTQWWIENVYEELDEANEWCGPIY